MVHPQKGSEAPRAVLALVFVVMPFAGVNGGVLPLPRYSGHRRQTAAVLLIAVSLGLRAMPGTQQGPTE